MRMRYTPAAPAVIRTAKTTSCHQLFAPSRAAEPAFRRPDNKTPIGSAAPRGTGKLLHIVARNVCVMKQHAGA